MVKDKSYWKIEEDKASIMAKVGTSTIVEEAVSIT